METVCFRVKLKAGSLEGVRKWFQTLRERSAEVIQTLEQEEVYIESVFLDKIGNDDYIIYYLRAKDIAHARLVTQKSTLPIDVYHKECKQNYCVENIKLEPLLDFHR